MSLHTDELKNILSASKKLFVPVFVSLCIVTSIVVISANPHSYATSLQLKERLLHDTHSPRLIVMGGSGAASSIDSAKLGQELRLTPVNMGLFAGVGMRFIINQVKDDMGEGDILLLAPEYEMLQQPSYGDGAYLLQTLHANPSKVRDMVTPHGIIVMTRAFPSVLAQEGRRIIHTIRNYYFPQELLLSERLYTLENVSKNGDLDTRSAGDTHLSMAQIKIEGDGFVKAHIDGINLSLIANFASEAAAKGAQIFVVLPAIPEAVKTQNMPHITTQYEELVSVLGNEHVIGTPGYFTIPDTQFLDSIGHLTAEGKVIRTDLIRKAFTNRNTVQPLSGK